MGTLDQMQICNPHASKETSPTLSVVIQANMAQPSHPSAHGRYMYPVFKRKAPPTSAVFLPVPLERADRTLTVSPSLFSLLLSLCVCVCLPLFSLLPLFSYFPLSKTFIMNQFYRSLFLHLPAVVCHPLWEHCGNTGTPGTCHLLSQAIMLYS